MTTSTSLSRIRLAAKACTYGAVIIGVMGLILLLLYVLAERSIIPQDLQSNSSLIFGIVLVAFLIGGLTLFFSLTLYALGTLLHYISKEEKVPKEEAERMEIIAIPALHPLQEEI